MDEATRERDTTHGLGDEIAYLTRQTWEATDPVAKFHLYRDLIGVGLQAVEDDGFRDEVARELAGLVFDEETFRTLTAQGYAAETLERFHYAARLGDITLIWSRVASRLRATEAGFAAATGFRALRRRRGIGFRFAFPFRPRDGLLLGAAVLLVTNGLLLVAAVLGALGSAPGGFDAATALYVALSVDLVGVAFLGSFFLAGTGVRGAARRTARAAGTLFLAWVGLTAVWRYALPAILGTDYQALLFDVLAAGAAASPPLRQAPGVVAALLGLWVLSALLFVVAHGLLLRVPRVATPQGEEGLPTQAWLAAAVASLAGTALLVHGLAASLFAGGGGYVLAGALLKLVVAPNLFVSAYAESLRAGVRAARTPAWGWEAEATS